MQLARKKSNLVSNLLVEGFSFSRAHNSVYVASFNFVTRESGRLLALLKKNMTTVTLWFVFCEFLWDVYLKLSILGGTVWASDERIRSRERERSSAAESGRCHSLYTPPQLSPLCVQFSKIVHPVSPWGCIPVQVVKQLSPLDGHNSITAGDDRSWVESLSCCLDAEH